MEFSDINKWAQKLSSRGVTEHLENGKEAVPVSLMLTGKLTEKSREVRKEMLKSQFSDKLAGLANSNIEVDFNSISPSAQTIQAKLGIEDLQFFVNELKQQDLEIYPNDLQSLTE
jgi:hypothetical protein